MLNLTPENIDSYSTLYPLDETNTDTLNWCNEMLVEYKGNCPASVEVSFDYSILLSSVTGKKEDTDTSKAVYNNIISKKEANFNIGWTDIKSLVWSNDLNRYEVNTEETSNVMRTTLCAGICDSTKIDAALPPCTNTLTTSCYDSTYVIRNIKDEFDSLIYVGIIDTNRYSIEGMMFIDRTEWVRHEIQYETAE